MDELEFYNGALTGAEIDRRIISVNCGTLSATTDGGTFTATVNNANITAKHKVIAWNFGTPRAQNSRWLVTTDDGSLTITGNISGSTTLVLELGIPL